MKIPHVAWREGRPRFQPGPRLRAAGWKGFDLRHEDGRWFSRGEALDWSEAFGADRRAAARKAAGKQRPERRAPVRQAAPRLDASASAAPCTVAELFRDFFLSPKFQIPDDPAEARRQAAAGIVYAAKTIVDYRQKSEVIAAEDPMFWNAPAAALTTPVVFTLYEQLLVARGVATARGAIAVLSVALKWGRKRGRFTFALNDGQNPAHDLDMATPPPRVRFGTRLEIETLVAAADALGRPEVGDMIVLGVWTGQRQADRLALEDRGLVNGRRVFRQEKTGAIVAVRQAPEIEARLAASALRRRAARAAALVAAPPGERDEVERRFSRVVLNELVDSRYGKCFWRPFAGQAYSHLYAEIRAAAIAGIPAEAPGGEWRVKPCKSLATLTDQDLRDTAVTWLALAGVDIPGICAITGHSLQSATRVLRHYLAMHPELADQAMGKMIAWHDAGGETEIGL